MWDDEDNNPYGSFARHDSNASDAPGLASPTARKTLEKHSEHVAGPRTDFAQVPYRPATPPSEASSPAQESPEYVSHRDMSDVDYNDDQEEEEEEEEETVTQKKGGYDARVEQWLHEHPDQVILITNAGKEGVNYIQYTISCGVCMPEDEVGLPLIGF
jgi:hypothetical protein